MGGNEAREAKLLRFEALRAQFAGTTLDPVPAQTMATGLPAIDERVGGLFHGAINEFSGSPASGALFLGVLLEHMLRDGTHLALVDAGDSFEPNQWSAPLLHRMLWVRCHSTKEAIRSVDLLLRDGNLPVVVLDLQACTEISLRRVPGSTWHRFARTLEASGTVLVILSVRPTAEGVRLRITDDRDWSFESLQEPRPGLRSALRLAVRERGVGTQKRFA